MRISDWSSDVCSSDLENSGTASSLLVGPECIKRFEITGVDEQGQRLDADATGKLVDRHRRGLVEDARKQRRSEEHTSELQSLMRNSYAVFSLKNKKYSHKNNTLITDTYCNKNTHKLQ